MSRSTRSQAEDVARRLIAGAVHKSWTQRARSYFLAGVEWAQERARIDAERQIVEQRHRAERSEATEARVRAALDRFEDEHGVTYDGIDCLACLTSEMHEALGDDPEMYPHPYAIQTRAEENR